VSGLPDHRITDVNLVDHLVAQIENKAAEIEKERAEASLATA
jgi:hypothetical protein